MATSVDPPFVPPRKNSRRRRTPPEQPRRAAAARYCEAGVSTRDRWTAAKGG